MVINTTQTPFSKFTAMQRLALNGETVETIRVDSIEQFGALYDKMVGVTRVIVDGANFVLANDIVNYVMCEVVLLNAIFEIDEDIEHIYFETYDSN